MSAGDEINQAIAGVCNIQATPRPIGANNLGLDGFASQCTLPLLPQLVSRSMAEPPNKPGWTLNELSKVGLTGRVPNPFETVLTGSAFALEGQWFHNKRIELDGFKFVRCRFDNCELVTVKGNFSFDHCFISGCSMFYGGDAVNVVRLYNISATEWKERFPILGPRVEADGTISIK